MQTDNEMGKTLRIAKILHIALMASILIYAVILFVFLPAIELWVFPPDDPVLTRVEWALGIVAIIAIFLGYYLPRLATRRYRQSVQGLLPLHARLLLVHIIRSSLFESIAIYGLMLGILGAGEQITIAIMVVSLGALILSFPNAEKWKKMIAPKDIYSKYD